MMAIWTVTMVRNEADIIESFVRYHAGLADRMIIIDNESSDRTPEILSSLRSEGLPIELAYEATAAYKQSDIVTHYTRAAFERGASAVLPLDADEFFHPPPGTPSRESLRDLICRLICDTVVEIEWVTMIPTELDRNDEPNPLKRITTRRAVQFNKDAKVLIPRAVFVERPDLIVSQGSHRVLVKNGVSMSSRKVTEAVLIHFPIRGAEHATRKFLVGWLANLARPERVLFDWLPYYHLAKRGQLGPDEAKEIARAYNARSDAALGAVLPFQVELERSGWSGDLRYTVSEEIPNLTIVLSYAEQLADQLSLLSGRQALPDAPSPSEVLERIYGFQIVPGWLSPQEAVLLYQAVASVRAPDAQVCEIGSWRGRSACVLGTALRIEKPRGRLYCVDPLDGTGDEWSANIYQAELHDEKSNLQRELESTLARWGLVDYVTVVGMRSTEAANHLPEELDVVFIDGDHSFDAVSDDIVRIGHRIRPGGYLLVHDVGSPHFDGPRRAVELLVNESRGWRPVALQGELFCAVRLPLRKRGDDECA